MLHRKIVQPNFSFLGVWVLELEWSVISVWMSKRLNWSRFCMKNKDSGSTSLLLLLRSAIPIPLGLLAHRRRAFGHRLRGSDQPGCHLLPGLLPATPVPHESGATVDISDACGTGARHEACRHAARTAEDVRLSGRERAESVQPAVIL